MSKRGFRSHLVRYFDEETGDIRLVVKPNAPYQDKYEAFERFDPEIHTGPVRCLTCEAGLAFARGHDQSLGNIPVGQKDHLKTARRQKHDEGCIYKPKPGQHRYDDKLGYRVHVNMGDLHEAFKDAAAPYKKNEKGLFVLQNEYRHLAQYRPYQINSIRDLIRLIERGEPERLAKSVFIYRGEMLSLNEFLIRYSRNTNAPQQRFIDLYERLQSKPKGRQTQFCAMEIQSANGVKPYSDGTHRDFFRAKTKGVFWYKDLNDKGEARKHFIVPRVFLDEDDTGYNSVEFEMPEGGTYMVEGIARLERTKSYGDNTRVMHFINVSARSQEAILQVDMDRVIVRAQSNYERRIGILNPITKIN